MSVSEEIEIAVNRLVDGDYFKFTPRIETVGALIDKILELAEQENVISVLDEHLALEDFGEDVRAMEIYDEQMNEKHASSYERIAELAKMVMDVVDQRNE